MARPRRSNGVANQERPRSTPTISNDMAARPQDSRGNQMELQLIIGAGIAASGIITALLLRWQNDPLEEDIRAAMQYETKQQKIAKAIRK